MNPFLPNFCDVRILLLVVLGSIFLALLMTLVSGVEESFGAELGLRGIFIAWVALLSAFFLCSFRRLISKFQVFVQAIYVVLLITGVTVFLTWVAFELLSVNAIQGHSPYLRHFSIALLISLALLHYFHLQYQWRQQVQAEAEARLQALQARMRPHFLFNSLNSIAELIATDTVAAEDRIADLAESLRAAMRLDSQKLVPLAQELDLTRHYLALEQARLGERLQIRWKIELALKETQVPPFCLQPLVENAVYYGVEPSSDGGQVEISAIEQKGYIVLSVRNTIPKSVTRKRKGNHIALQNIKARLSASFKQQASLWISTAEGWYQVRLRIPLNPIN